MKIQIATNEEKKAYAATKPVYPLHGFVIVSGIRCPVEYLGEGPGEPNWEVLTPEGFQFDDGRHSILGTTQLDMLDQISGLEKDTEAK